MTAEVTATNKESTMASFLRRVSPSRSRSGNRRSSGSPPKRNGNDRFNAEAAAWDSNPDVHKASASALEAILARFPLLLRQKGDNITAEEGLDVLEIGCGTGLLSFRLAPYVRSLLAVDASSGMIDALNQKMQRPDSPKNVTPLCIMLEDPEDVRLPAAVNSRAGGFKGHGMTRGRKKFDLVISHLVLHHIPDLDALLKTMHGCLKPGGYIALTDFEDFGPEARAFHPEAKMEGVERHGINREWFKGLMEGQGFVDARCETGWVMRKDVERFPGEWGQKKPTEEEMGSEGFEQMDFPFLLCLGKKQ